MSHPEPSPPSVVAVAQTSDRARIERWSLALLALNIPHQTAAVLDGSGQVALLVRTQDERTASQTLVQVDEEDAQRIQELRERPPLQKTPQWAIWVAQGLAMVLLGVALWAGFRADDAPLVEHGQMDAALVLRGAWYRLFTAVTLHADAAHLLSNSAFLLVVAPTVIHRVGPGVATASVFLCGAAGNVATAVYHQSLFTNVGASAGVFGLVCMLAVLAARTRRSTVGHNRWLVGLGAGLALLALMGFGEKADVVAHMGGFFAGAPIALLAPLTDARAGPSRTWWVAQTALGVASLGLVAWCWRLAMASGGWT